jgi:acetylornithine deacetylase
MSPPRFTAVELVERLVGFDTTSANSNLALIEWVRDYLAGHGIEARLFHDESGRKANLYATIGPREAGGVVLSGHSDVVPVAGQAWRSDPFHLVEREGRLYGRGTADMKSFIAAALALVPEMTARPLATPIHLAFSYDEEVGCLGAPRMIREIARGTPRPRLVIVGEPTEMRVVSAHKGCTVLRTRVVGREAHSSAPHRAASAILAAGELLHFLGGIAAEMAARPPRPGSSDGEFEPPYSTLNVGTIEGGTALNIIPKECSFRWECRALPGTGDDQAVVARLAAFAEERVAPRLRAAAPDGGVFTEIAVVVPPLAAAPDSPAEAFARALTGDNRAGVVSYGSEAGQFQEAGIPAVLCGPGNIREAHQPDEYIERSQIDACVAFLRRLIARCAA